MIELNSDNDTESQLFKNQTITIVDNYQNEQQKKENILDSIANRHSLLSLSQDDSDFNKEISQKYVVENVQSHTRVKRKYDDIIDTNCTDEQTMQPNAHCSMSYCSVDSPEQLPKDDTATFIESAIVEEYCAKLKRCKPDVSLTSAWRLGPAKYWFDLLGVPETGDGFDYGFELAEEMDEEEEDESYLCDSIEEDAFLMVSQVHWEDDIIWDHDESIQKKKLDNREVTDWISTPKEHSIVLPEEWPKIIKSQNGTFYSNFPVENEELVYGLWESEIIWDAKAMRKILQPKILGLDPNDENVILAIPNEPNLSLSYSNDEAQSKKKIIYPHTENIKSILSKTGITLDSSEGQENPKVEEFNLDPFNISNDMYYMPKSTDKWLKLNASHQKHIPHSIPVLRLQAPLVPTYLKPSRLRNLHRSLLKRYTRGRLSQPGPHAVLSLTKYISKKEKLRQAALKAGELFFMRSFEDLSGRDGKLVLVEFTEEHPPLMNFIGMCSKIKNYYKRKPGKDTGPPEYKYGETTYPQSDLFIGKLVPGQSLQALENNMYRAPIYEHKVNETDFLVIRTRNQYYIREIDALYVVGQQCPLYEVPAPNSRKVVEFMKNILQVFAYKMFSKSKTNPPKIHKNVLKKAFPTLSASFIKKHLSFCADYINNKGASDCFHWVLKPTFRLPSEDEIRSLISPEQCCAYFSMAAAEQRLKDAGYGDKSALVLQDNDANDDEIQSQLDDEIKAAPWNTTRAYIDAMNGKCCLQLTGPADPTGCGEGCSYIRVSNKSIFKQDISELQPKKITGTEADLRYLSAKGAETILRNYGISAPEIKKLTRWEMIDAVRTLSTIREDRGEEGFAKFSRSKRFSIAVCQKRYREECQRIFDLQNRVLSSSEVFSSEDEDDFLNENMKDVEKMAENIENLLISEGKSGSLLQFEREEREREELLKMLAIDTTVEEKSLGSKKDETLHPNVNLNPNSKTSRTLKIHRTFRNVDGSEYTRTEIVHDLQVIDAYLKIRSTKNATFIKQYAYADEEVEREKKKIETELKMIKNRNKRKEKLENKLSKQLSGEKVNSGDCGKYGRVNSSSMNGGAKNQLYANDQRLVKVSETKMKDGKNTKSLKTSIQNTSKETGLTKKRKRSSGNDEIGSSTRYQRPAGTNRPRTDPVVVLSTIFEEILTVIRGQKEFQPFLFPVNTKILPEYRRIIGRPMDLETIRDNIGQKKYQSRREFLGDIIQIKENSARYNGQMNPLTDSAQRMLNMCVKLLAKKEDKIIKLENVIKPLLDDNDQETFSNMMGMVIKEVKSMPQAIPFLKPVNKNLIGSKNYYNIVKNPMDLDTISKKIATHKYRSRAEIIEDFQLIYNNCILYNGQNSQMKTKAEILLTTVVKHFNDLSHQVLHLESSIASVQEKAMRQANIDTSWKYEDVIKDDRVDFEAKWSVKISRNSSQDGFDETSMDTESIERDKNSPFDMKFEVTATNSLNLSEDDSEDSSAGNYTQKNPQSTILPGIRETSVLEEDLQFSSDDDEL